MQNVQIREVFQIGEVSNKRGFTVHLFIRVWLSLLVLFSPTLCSKLHVLVKLKKNGWTKIRGVLNVAHKFAFLFSSSRSVCLLVTKSDSDERPSWIDHSVRIGTVSLTELSKYDPSSKFSWTKCMRAFLHTPRLQLRDGCERIDNRFLTLVCVETLKSAEMGLLKWCSKNPF